MKVTKSREPTLIVILSQSAKDIIVHDGNQDVPPPGSDWQVYATFAGDLYRRVSDGGQSLVVTWPCLEDGRPLYDSAIEHLADIVVTEGSEGLKCRS